MSVVPRQRKWPALRAITLPPPVKRTVPPLSPGEVIPRWGCKRLQCRVLLLPEDALPQPQQKRKRNSDYKKDEKKEKTKESEKELKVEDYSIDEFEPLASREGFEEDYRRFFGEEPPPRPSESEEEDELKEQMARPVATYAYFKSLLLTMLKENIEKVE